jgi:hypothetical protein
MWDDLQDFLNSSFGLPILIGIGAVSCSLLGVVGILALVSAVSGLYA